MMLTKENYNRKQCDKRTNFQIKQNGKQYKRFSTYNGSEKFIHIKNKKNLKKTGQPNFTKGLKPARKRLVRRKRKPSRHFHKLGRIHTEQRIQQKIFL